MLSSPNVVIAIRTTPTSPFPGPVIVTLLPPKMDTSIPPTTAVIIPDIGGASLAIASPKPRGSAIRLTTNPEKIFRGSVLKKLFMEFSFGLIVRLKHL